MRSLNDGVCSCLSGKYNARLGICNDCHISCAECDGPDSNHCTECKDNSTISETDGTCTCDEGYYLYIQYND
jgi:hypothetical protein